MICICRIFSSVLGKYRASTLDFITNWRNAWLEFSNLLIAVFPALSLFTQRIKDKSRRNKRKGHWEIDSLWVSDVDFAHKQTYTGFSSKGYRFLSHKGRFLWTRFVFLKRKSLWTVTINRRQEDLKLTPEFAVIKVLSSVRRHDFAFIANYFVCSSRFFRSAGAIVKNWSLFCRRRLNPDPEWRATTLYANSDPKRASRHLRQRQDAASCKEQPHRHRIS